MCSPDLLVSHSSGRDAAGFDQDTRARARARSLARSIDSTRPDPTRHGTAQNSARFVFPASQTFASLNLPVFALMMFRGTPPLGLASTPASTSPARHHQVQASRLRLQPHPTADLPGSGTTTAKTPSGRQAPPRCLHPPLAARPPPHPPVILYLALPFLYLALLILFLPSDSLPCPLDSFSCPQDSLVWLVGQLFVCILFVWSVVLCFVCRCVAESPRLPLAGVWSNRPHLFVCLFACLFACLLACLCVCLLVCLLAACLLACLQVCG